MTDARDDPSQGASSRELDGPPNEPEAILRALSNDISTGRQGPDRRALHKALTAPYYARTLLLACGMLKESSEEATRKLHETVVQLLAQNIAPNWARNLPKDHQAFIRENIIDLTLNAPHYVRPQYLRAVRHIYQGDTHASGEGGVESPLIYKVVNIMAAYYYRYLDVKIQGPQSDTQTTTTTTAATTTKGKEKLKGEEEVTGNEDRSPVSYSFNSKLEAQQKFETCVALLYAFSKFHHYHIFNKKTRAQLTQLALPLLLKTLEACLADVERLLPSHIGILQNAIIIFSFLTNMNTSVEWQQGYISWFKVLASILRIETKPTVDATKSASSSTTNIDEGENKENGALADSQPDDINLHGRRNKLSPLLYAKKIIWNIFGRYLYRMEQHLIGASSTYATLTLPEPETMPFLVSAAHVAVEALHQQATQKLPHSALVKAEITFLTNALRHNATWKAIKPKVLELIDSLLVLIQITPENYKLFSENPVLYMRRETDSIFALSDEVIEGPKLIQDLIIKSSNKVFSSIYAALLARLNSSDLFVRDAALAALAWFPFHGPKKQSLLTQVLQENILPIIDNSEERPLLRSRACMALVALIDHLDGTRGGSSGGHVNDSFDSLRDEDFFDSDDEFLVGDKNVERDRARMEANKEVLLRVVDITLRCMQPQEVLPLRVYSTMAISRTLERFIAITTVPPLSSSIRWILETILELIEVIATDELIPGLQTIVSLLAPEEVAKHAIHLCQHLVATFDRVTATPTGPPGQDEDRTSVAIGCVEAINSVINALFPQSSLRNSEIEKNSILVLNDITVLLVPWCKKILTDHLNDLVDYIEDIIQTIALLTYYLVPLPEYTFELFNPLCSLVDPSVVSHFFSLSSFDPISMPLENYISNGTKIFLSSDVYSQTFYNTCVSVGSVLPEDWANEDMRPLLENVEPFSCLLSALFLYCKGHSEFYPWMGKYLHLVVSMLPKAPPLVFCWLFTVVCSALYCHPTMTINLLIESKRLETVFETLNRHKDFISMVFMQNGSWRKSYLIGFSSLLSAIHEDTPTIVTDGMLDFLLSMLSKYSDDCIEKQHLQDEKARLKTENKQLRSRVQHLEEAYERLDSMHSGDHNNNTPSSERKRKRDEGEEGLEAQKESPRDEEKEEETRKKARTEEKEGEDEKGKKDEQKDEEEETQTVKKKKVEDNEKKEWKRSAERLRRDREFYPPMMGPTGPRSVEDMAGLMQLAMDQHPAERQAGVPPEHSLNDMEDRLAELIEHAQAARTPPSAAFSPGIVPPLPHFDLSPEAIEDFNDQSPDSLLQLWDLVDDSDMRQSPLDEVDVFAHFYSCIQELQVRDLHAYHMLMGSLNQEKYKLMEGLLQIGSERNSRIKSLVQLIIQSICKSEELFQRIEVALATNDHFMPVSLMEQVVSYKEVTKRKPQRKITTHKSTAKDKMGRSFTE